MSEAEKFTLRQLMEALRDRIAWLRVFPGGQMERWEEFHGLTGLWDAVQRYGEKTVWRVYPGYYFVEVYVD